MAALTPQQISQTGLAPAYSAAAAGGDTFQNDGRMFLHVKNGGGGSITATVNSVVNCSQGHDHDLAVAVPAGAERMIGPFQASRFNQSGSVAVSYSGVSSVTVAVIRL